MNTATVMPPKSTAFSGNSRFYLKPGTLLFRYLAIINLIVGAWYLQWRVRHSINLDALWLSIPLLLAEIYFYVGGAMFITGLWRPLVRRMKALDQMVPPLPRAGWPTVDVFITCYNEPVEIVERTARAALAIDYPVTKLRVYVLDDGNSSDMRGMVQQLCLEDLQTPLLQVEVRQIQAERTQLLQRLGQLNQVAPDVQAAETFLCESQPSPPHPTIRSLQALQQLVLLLSPDHANLGDRLVAERKYLEQAIAAREMALTELARCRYIARPKPAGRPHYAKAGNINYALFSGNTTGTFILTLDADHIPKSQILKRVLPYFFTYNLPRGSYENNQIALVQTPQDFYNLPPGDPFGHQAHLFYGPIQQGKDGVNAAFYTGTNAILRREALMSVGLSYFAVTFAQDETRLDEYDLVGGMSSSSITEDMNTAMRLHAAGWRTIYHNELLAEGLAPDDLGATLKQRLRWAQGTIQVMLQENPLTKPGLTLLQRIQYFQTMYSYFSGFATVVLIACPIIFFFTGIIPVRAFGTDFVLHFVPAFLMNRLTFMAVAWGIPAQEIWRAEQYAFALFPLFIQAVWSVFTKRPIRFQVTPKQRRSGIYLNLIKPQLAAFGLILLGMVWCLFRFFSGNLENPQVYLVNSLWAAYHLALLWAIIQAAVWQPKPGVRDSKL